MTNEMEINVKTRKTSLDQSQEISTEYYKSYLRPILATYFQLYASLTGLVLQFNINKLN